MAGSVKDWFAFGWLIFRPGTQADKSTVNIKIAVFTNNCLCISIVFYFLNNQDEEIPGLVAFSPRKQSIL
jgi:hypothetical protein